MTTEPVTDAIGNVIGVQLNETREGDRTLLWLTVHGPDDDVEHDDALGEIGLDMASATRLAANLLNAVYQAVYVATGNQDSDDCNGLCHGWWGAYEAALILDKTASEQ
jgi:hypothetical protein